ncbi:hypothetical protein [Acidovorax sp.]|jgi:hypothetical protein|uniref:hypothetical protein n=1 Tax=Acidovorax sp. TaxID=1872122 RepID=UPI0025BF9D6B|nr:hypothetical protein [Acidovorax sp.]
MKSMHLFAKRGANRSDSCSYREDLQRSMADKGAISCQCFGETEYSPGAALPFLSFYVSP